MPESDVVEWVKDDRAKPARAGKPPKLDSAGFMAAGKQIVIDNFNTHRKPERSPELSVGDIHVVWFTKALGVWKMIISSYLARGLLWEVVYNSAKDEIYLDVYSKLNNIKISLGRDADVAGS